MSIGSRTRRSRSSQSHTPMRAPDSHGRSMARAAGRPLVLTRRECGIVGAIAVLLPFSGRVRISVPCVSARGRSREETQTSRARVGDSADGRSADRCRTSESSRRPPWTLTSPNCCSERFGSSRRERVKRCSKFGYRSARPPPEQYPRSALRKRYWPSWRPLREFGDLRPPWERPGEPRLTGRCPSKPGSSPTSVCSANLRRCVTPETILVSDLVRTHTGPQTRKRPAS